MTTTTTTSIVPGIVTDVGAVAGAVSDVSKAVSAGIDVVQANQNKQAGVDAANSASLAASEQIAREQVAALIDAPTDEAGTIEDMRKGEF